MDVFRRFKNKKSVSNEELFNDADMSIADLKH